MKQQHKLQPPNNKRHFISLFSFLLLLFLFTSSCQDEEIYLIDSPDSSFNIEDAKSWFEINNSPIMILNATEPINANNKLDAKPKNIKQILLQNDWKHAFKTKRGHLEVVEVALKSKGFFGFADPSSTKKWKQTKNYGYLRSISRLIIIKNNKDNSIKSAIMTIVGSTNYLEKNNFKYGSNTYLKKEKDFEGMVFFNTLEGNFINGWEIKKGKVTGKLTKKTALSKDYALKGESEECHWEVITRHYYEGTDWYNVAESANGDNIYISYTGTTWEYVQETGEPYEVCVTTYGDVDDDIDPDLGDGGGGPPEDNTATYPYPHCSSFEYAQPAGESVKACAVLGLSETFYAYGEQNGVNGTFEFVIDFPIIYFIMPTYMTNGHAATYTATAVNNAFNSTQAWFEINPEATEQEIGEILDTNLLSEMMSFGGTITYIPPFNIPSPAPYVTSFINTGSCN